MVKSVCPKCGYQKSKYGVDLSDKGKEDRTYNGRVYASKAEKRCAMRLDREKELGIVAEWVPQPRFPLHSITGAKVCTYIADFRVTYPDGSVEIWDVKNVATATPLFNLKAKMYAQEYPALPLVLVK